MAAVAMGHAGLSAIDRACVGASGEAYLESTAALVHLYVRWIRPDVRGILRGEGWVVADGMYEVGRAISKVQGDDSGMSSMVEVMPKPWPTPPTYFKLNAFTTAYQVGAIFPKGLHGSDM